MGKKTGQPRGRPPGAKNKRTEALDAAVKAAAEKIAELIPDAFDGDAHAFLMMVYKDPAQPVDLRLEAARAAIRFEKPALAAVDHSGEVNQCYVARMPAPIENIDEWQRLYGNPSSVQ